MNRKSIIRLPFSRPIREWKHQSVKQCHLPCLQDGFGVLDWMRSFGVAPDTITFNTLMDVCAKAALSGRAKARHGQKVLDLMEVSLVN